MRSRRNMRMRTSRITRTNRLRYPRCAGLAEPAPTLKKGKEYLIMQQKPGALSVMLAVALALAALPSVGAAAAPLAADTQGPAVSAVAGVPNPASLGEAITVTATVDDAATGGSNIQSAEFSVNGGASAALAASDG